MLTLEFAREHGITVEEYPFAGGFAVLCFPTDSALAPPANKTGSGFDFNHDVAVSKAVGELIERLSLIKIEADRDEAYGLAGAESFATLIAHGQLGSAFAFSHEDARDRARRELRERFLRYQVLHGLSECLDVTDNIAAVREFGRTIGHRVIVLRAKRSSRWMLLASRAENAGGDGQLILSTAYEPDVKSQLVKVFKEHLMMLGAQMIPGLEAEKVPYTLEQIAQLPHHTIPVSVPVSASVSGEGERSEGGQNISDMEADTSTIEIPNVGYVSVATFTRLNV
jgi:hypothetical protein